ncbi:MAG: hypothetical protein A2606_04055 [Candidatus Yanofskybacteria bacterium RIFOXYD1_FULL_42_10]|uniref:Uncharacterized protein n=2 Tax=Candidatus Yanofskyibacteriota TaxID=1752733 RepID=A0A1F8HX67_9BACT|nr:MAG: hypothetical protein UU84_C0012G0005 [Candidatus Yanofskybacteria bacterium GW2011_GWC2_41_9]OGN41516.1 MAG: hypothetical protein A2606_04055 [Candidatus Yanofskybacteria bacterium RIFOXYD1_FULL_42_10]
MNLGWKIVIIVYFIGMALAYGALKNLRLSKLPSFEWNNIDRLICFFLSCGSIVSLIQAFQDGARGLTYRTPK